MQLEDAYYFRTIFNNKFIKKEIEFMIVQRELIYRVLTNKEVDRKIAFKIIKKMVEPTKWNVFLNLLLLSNFLSPSLSKKVYLKFMRGNSMLA
jgi:hypothetical protein